MEVVAEVVAVGIVLAYVCEQVDTGTDICGDALSLSEGGTSSVSSFSLRRFTRKS